MAFLLQEDYDFVKSQYDWLEANFANPGLKTDDLVSQSGLSRTAYYEKLKELTELSPKELITDFRMKKAAMYLENTNDTIAEVAAKTGFDDPILFTRTFKQNTGITPSKYREQKKKETEVGKDTPEAEPEAKTDDYELMD